MNSPNSHSRQSFVSFIVYALSLMFFGIVLGVRGTNYSFASLDKINQFYLHEAQFTRYLFFTEEIERGNLESLYKLLSQEYMNNYRYLLNSQKYLDDDQKADLSEWISFNAKKKHKILSNPDKYPTFVVAFYEGFDIP